MPIVVAKVTFLDTAEAAKELQVSTSYIRTLAAREVLKAFVGPRRKLYFAKSIIDAYRKAHPIAGELREYPLPMKKGS